MYRLFAPHTVYSKNLLVQTFTTSLNFKRFAIIFLMTAVCILAKTETSFAQKATLKTSQPLPAIYTNLMVAKTSGLFLVDGVGVGFGSQFSSAVDNDDAGKLWNFDENIAIVRDAHALAIEFRPLPVLTDTFFYKLYLKQQPYALKIITQNFAGLAMHAWLVDNYLHTRTLVNLNDTTLYMFTPNADTNSYRNRFMLLLNRQFSAGTTPVTRLTQQNGLTQTGIANNSLGAGNMVRVYPNPVCTGNAMLQFAGMPKNTYVVSVFNANGQMVKSFTIQHTGERANYVLPVDASWTNGTYHISITSQELKKPLDLQLLIRR